MKCDGTRAGTRFRLSAKLTSPFKSAGASVQSTAGSRGVRISGSNAGYTMFRDSVKGTVYPLHSPVSPFTSSPVRHRVPSHFNWSLRISEAYYSKYAVKTTRLLLVMQILKAFKQTRLTSQKHPFVTGLNFCATQFVFKKNCSVRVCLS